MWSQEITGIVIHKTVSIKKHVIKRLRCNIVEFQWTCSIPLFQNLDRSHSRDSAGRIQTGRRLRNCSGSCQDLLSKFNGP